MLKDWSNILERGLRMATEAEVKQALRQLIDYYAPKDMKPERLAIYAAQLQRLDGGVLADAVAKCLTTRTWFPKLNELFELAEGIEDDISQDKIYWHVMSMLSACFRGVITEAVLVNSRSWMWYERQREPCAEYNPAHDVDGWAYTLEETAEMKANDVSGDAIENNTQIGIKP